MSAFDGSPSSSSSACSRKSLKSREEGDAAEQTEVSYCKGVLLQCALPPGVASPPLRCPVTPCSPDFGSSGEEGCGGGGGTQMSKMNRLKLKMGLSIGDASTYQTHHRDEANMTPVDAAACESMTEITEYMYLGSWRDSSEAAVPQMKANGITHILNLAKEHAAEGEPDRHPGMVFTTIPMNDDHQEDLYERLLEAHAFIERAKEAGGKVLIHCRRGISRSPAIVVSYLMRYKGMSYADAYAYVAKRRRVSLNLAFRMFLDAWDPTTGRPPTSARAPIEASPSVHT